MERQVVEADPLELTLATTQIHLHKPIYSSSSSLHSSCGSTLTPSNLRQPQDSTNVTRVQKKNYRAEYLYDLSFIDDGYQWIKYKEESIPGFQYLRNYYRCIHKDDQGCFAIREDQRIQQDPPTYRTKYRGHHTCKTDIDSTVIPSKKTYNFLDNLDTVISANSKNYSGSYRREDEEKEEYIYIEEYSEMGKDLTLCHLPSHPSISSHDSVTSTTPTYSLPACTTSQTSSPSPSLHFNDVFCFQPSIN